MFERNTDRLIIIQSSFSCPSSEEDHVVRYLKANLPLALKRRAECLSCEILQPDANDIPANVNVEFLLGLMEPLKIVYGISHLLYLVIKKFQKIGIEINGEKISSEITDEQLKRLIKTIYEQLRKEKG